MKKLVLVAVVFVFLFAVVGTAMAQYEWDVSTVLLDHFDGTTVGTDFGPITYGDSLPVLGQAINLVSNSYVKYAFLGGVNGQGTVEMWIKPRQYSGILTLQWFDVTSPPSSGYVGGFVLRSDSKLRWWVWNGQGDGELAGITTIPLNEWTHVAVTWDSAGTKLYVNGVVDASTSANLWPAFSSTTYVYLNNWGQSDLGYVDELRISNVARSEEEIGDYVASFLVKTVTFDKNGGDTDAVPASITTNYNTTITLPAAPTKALNTFANWNTATDGTGTEFTAATKVTADIIVYAQWTAVTYTVTFDSRGGSPTPDPITGIAYNTTITLPAAPTKALNTFASWNTLADGTGTAFTAATPVIANVIVYAQYTINTYTVTFVDWNTTVLGISAVDYDTAATAPADPTRTGYTFAGWDVDFSHVKADMTVTATYTYTVTTEAATDVTSTDAQLNGLNGHLYADNYSFHVSLVPDLTAEDYWTGPLGPVDANAAFSTTLASFVPTVTPNTTYYFVAYVSVGGIWYQGEVLQFTTLDTYTLTVNKVSSGTVTVNPAGGTYDYGTVVTLTASPGTGWHFVSWSGDATGTALTTTVTMDGNKTVTATFAINTGTLTIGYWKTHAGFTGKNPDKVTPLLPISMGSITITSASDAVRYLSMNGDASNGINKLLAQLLGAKLNIKNGADGSAVSSVISAADSFLTTHGPTDWDSLSKAQKQQVLGWTSTLDDYNNGRLGHRP